MVPGLSELMEELTNALIAYVFTVLSPYITPIMQQTTGVLDEGSKSVIDSEDQYEVFTNPNASDPSHSLLSKDHFGLILNEPAGQIAQLVVENSVNLIVQAWSDNSDPDGIINQILEAFHHPYYATGRSNIQNKMFAHMEKWISGLGSQEGQQTIQALTKESVRAGKNKRFSSEDQAEPGYGGHSHKQGAYSASKKPSGASGGYGQHQTSTGYQTSTRRTEQSGTTHGGQAYGESRTEGYQSHGSRRDDDNTYGTSGGGGYRRTDDESNRYGGSGQEAHGYGASRRTEDTYGSGTTYGQTRREPEVHSSRRDADNYGSGQATYGQSRRDDDDDNRGSGHRQTKKKDDDDDDYKPHKQSHRKGDDDDEYKQHKQAHRKRDSDDDEYKPPKQSHRKEDDDDEPPVTRYAESHGGYGASYGKSEQKSYGGGQASRDDDNYGRSSSGYAPSYSRGGDDQHGDKGHKSGHRGKDYD